MLWVSLGLLSFSLRDAAEKPERRSLGKSILWNASLTMETAWREQAKSE